MVTYIRKDKIKDWHEIRALDNVVADFVFVSIDDVERRWHPHLETFPYYEVVYVCSGSLVMWMSGRPVAGGKGDIFIVKPGVPHREQSPPGKRSQLLCLATGFRRKSGRRCRFPLDLPRKIHLRAGHVVERVLLAIANEAYHRGVAYSAAIASYTMQMFIELAREARSATVPHMDVGEIRRNRLASEARQFIEGHYAQDLSLARIAQHFFLSPYHFSRIFKENNALSPIAYLTKVRMDNAKRLLRDPRLPIKAVAAQVGYDDPHYFTKVFTKEESVTPTTYRRASLLPA
jgi:AraC-like DNA-binding protein/mannose-6-phosphate isomerase-like protein (cupin superfamily)